MTVTTFYSVEAMWLGGGLSAAKSGDSLLNSLRRFGPLSRAMTNWVLGDAHIPHWVPLADAAPRIAELVEHNVRVDDDGRPDPDDGYRVGIKGSVVPSEFGGCDSVYLTALAGGRLWNSLEFETGSFQSPPDLSLVTYPIYRSVLETLAANWPCPWVSAYAFRSGEFTHPPMTEDEVYARLRRPFEIAWVAYLSAPLVKDLVPPSEIAFQRTRGGGMILSAVQDRLDPANPEHIRRSELLEAIMNERVGRFGRQLKQTAELPARIGPY